jgi:hypothetical protein
MWHWTPAMVNNLYMDELWDFLLRFEDMANQEKGRKKVTDLSWLRDPRRKEE